MHEFYRRLIALRKSDPDLSDPRLDAVDVRHGDQFLVMRRGERMVVANLAGRPQRITLPGVARRVLLTTEEGVSVTRDRIELPPESAAVVAL
jgi:maltooligosyltrehalose trehalohydrolase